VVEVVKVQGFALFPTPTILRLRKRELNFSE
jgi:hypothetical protein